MKRIRPRFLLVILPGIILLSLGCATYWGYGEIKPAPDITIEYLIENWEKYDISYTGYVNRPAGLMFDIKSDQKSLMGDRWYPVRDRGTFMEVIKWMRAFDESTPRVLRVVGPDKILYGYVYTNWYQVVARAVDEQTMRVLDLPPVPRDPEFVPAR